MPEPIKAFRDAVEDFVRLSVMGSESESPDGRLASSYDQQFINQTVGDKGYMLRLWQVEQDEATDVNASYPVVGVEVTVVRHISYEGDEFLYVAEDEMFMEQRKLSDKTSWRALPSSPELIDGPLIEVPEREDNTIQYTLAAVVRLTDT